MGKTKIESPTPPPAPTMAQTMADYITALPQLYEAQAKYAPQLMEQQLNLQRKYDDEMLNDYLPKLTQKQFELQQQYTPQLIAAQKNAMEQLYPELTSINKTLAQQAQAGMTETMPGWYANKYDDYYKSLLGENARSPIGADAYSTGMLEQQKSWNDYYRNLGAQVGGAVPVMTPAMAQFNPGSYQGYDLMSGFSPSAGMQYASTNYGNYSNLYGNMYKTNADMAQFNANKPFQYMNAAGNLAGGLFGTGGVGSFMNAGKKSAGNGFMI